MRQRAEAVVGYRRDLAWAGAMNHGHRRGPAYLGLAAAGSSFVLLDACFVAAGIGIGFAETAEHAAVAHVAPESLRGSAFGVIVDWGTTAQLLNRANFEAIFHENSNTITTIYGTNIVDESDVVVR